MSYCPIMRSAMIIGYSVIQASKGAGYNTWDEQPTMAAQCECVREECQLWGYWTWAEEVDQYTFERKVAAGCTLGGGGTVVQRDGASSF